MPRSRRRSVGEGSIRKRSYTRRNGSKRVRYAAVVTAGWEGGRQKQLEGPLRATEAEAVADLKEMNRQKDEGVLNAADPTLAEYLDYWLGQIKPQDGAALERSRRQLSPKTYKGYVGDVKNHIKPGLGKVKLGKLEPVRVQAWQRGLEKDKSVFVARSAAATLSSACSRAVAWRLLQRSPFEGGAVMRPALPEKEADYWEPSEAARFITHPEVTGHPFYVGFYLTLNLGLRMGELRGLEHGDVVGLMNRRTSRERAPRSRPAPGGGRPQRADHDRAPEDEKQRPLHPVAGERGLATRRVARGAALAEGDDRLCLPQR